MPLIPGQQRQEDLCELKASLVYIVPGQPWLCCGTLPPNTQRVLVTFIQLASQDSLVGQLRGRDTMLPINDRRGTEFTSGT